MARAERKAAAAESAITGIMTKAQVRLVLFGLMAGMFLSALDQSVVGSAMRTIADDLQGLELQAWVTTAYLITSTVTTPIYGKLGDIFGRRRLFIAAITIFVIGSVACGFADSMYQLAAFRALQGIGAGGLFSLALTILADIVSPRERARYQGLFLAVFGTSSVVGPVVGGFFAGIDSILFVEGWRWIFLINIPIGAWALAMVVAFLHVPHTPRPSRIDWWGAVTIILAVVPLLLVLELGREWGWTSWLSIGMFALSVVGIVSFILVERAMKSEALLPLSLFKNRTFSMSTVLGVIVGFGMFGGMLTLPLVLQVAEGATPTEAGFLMLPMVGGLMVASVISGQVTARTGKYKIFLVVGTLVMTLAYLYLSTIQEEWEIWQISAGMVLLGLGIGQLMQTLTIATQNAVDVRDIGVATSSATFFRQMGGTTGVAIFLSILFSTLPDRITSAFQRADIRDGIMAAMEDPAVAANPANAQLIEALRTQDISGLTELLNIDSSFLIGLDERLARPFLMAFTESSVLVFSIATVVSAIAFVFSFFVKELPLRDKSAIEEAAALSE